MPKNLQILPEISKLQAEIVSLEKQLGKMILEQDEIINAIKPNLEAEYQKLIGYKELECLENEIASLRLKRQIELLQAAINRQEEIDPNKIDQELDNELKEWYSKLEEQFNKVKEAESRIEGLMTDEDNKEFKKLYRKLVFKLHPDLNPNQSDNDVNLWHRVQMAYQGGDLEEIRSLMIVLKSHDKASELLSSKESLIKRKMSLSDQIQKIIGKLADMEKEFPFTIANNLSDEKWVESKLEGIGVRVRHFEDKCKEYNELLKVLLVSKETGIN